MPSLNTAHGSSYLVTLTTLLSHLTAMQAGQTRSNYCTSDVADLIELYTTLSGPALDDTYRHTTAHITNSS